VKNAGGLVDMYVVPTAPKEFEKNWIPTVPGQAWFTYFRLYAPTEAYFDKSWPLPDIEKVKSRCGIRALNHGSRIPSPGSRIPHRESHIPYLVSRISYPVTPTPPPRCHTRFSQGLRNLKWQFRILIPVLHPAPPG